MPCRNRRGGPPRNARGQRYRAERMPVKMREEERGRVCGGRPTSCGHCAGETPTNPVR
jgi:hypothetical protein